MINDDRPAWYANSTQLWEEDECLLHDPTAEHISGAWRRLFGEPLPSKGLARYDGGDHQAHLYPGGRISVMSFDGWKIRQAQEGTYEPVEQARKHEDELRESSTQPEQGD